LKYRIPCVWPIYTCERRTTFAKEYGIKVRCYGEHVGQHNGNLRNLIGTHWEFSGMGQNLNGEKARHLQYILGEAIGCMKFLFPKEFVTIFGLGQYPLQRTPYLLFINNKSNLLLFTILFYEITHTNTDITSICWHLEGILDLLQLICKASFRPS